MLKYLWKIKASTFFVVMMINSVSAQKVKRDTLIYPMFFSTDLPGYYSPAVWVDDKRKANGFRLVVSPDTVNSNLFIVNDCFLNGDMRFRGKSTTNNVYVTLQGTCIEYYKNNNPKAVSNYNDGKLIGEVEAYYPNGRFYFSGIYNDQGILEIHESKDSLGKQMVSEGNGEFVKYDSLYNYIEERGNYDKGRRVGDWQYFRRGDLISKNSYENGLLKSHQQIGTDNTAEIFVKVDKIAEYQGGLEAFYKMLANNVRYPPKAFESRTQGKVFVTFVVEKDGSLTGVRTLRSIGTECDEEAMRVIKLSSGKWTPALLFGAPRSYAIYGANKFFN